MTRKYEILKAANLMAERATVDAIQTDMDALKRDYDHAQAEVERLTKWQEELRLQIAIREKAIDIQS